MARTTFKVKSINSRSAECMYCPKSYGRSEQRNMHMVSAHIRNRTTGFICPTLHCHKKFQSYTYVLQHLKVHRIRVDNKAKCKDCNGIYGSDRYLLNHYLALHDNSTDVIEKISGPDIPQLHIGMDQVAVGDWLSMQYTLSNACLNLSSASNSKEKPLLSPAAPIFDDSLGAHEPGLQSTTQTAYTLPLNINPPAALYNIPPPGIPLSNTRDEDQLMVCPHCELLILDETVLADHRKLHSHEDPFKCGICGHQGENKTGFIWHLLLAPHLYIN